MITAVYAWVCLMNFLAGCYISYFGRRWLWAPGKWLGLLLFTATSYLVYFAQENYQFHANILDIESSLVFAVAGYGGGRLLRRRRGSIPILADAAQSLTIGDWADARGLLERALAFDLPLKQQAEALTDIAVTHWNERDLPRARQTAQRALDIVDLSDFGEDAEIRALLNEILATSTEASQTSG